MIEIDAALVASLVGTQFPQWAGLPVVPVAAVGWDNRTFRLGERMLVRLPSAERYVAQVAKEQRWLPLLAPRLPLPIPAPLALGAPGAGYPWPWSVYRWLDGEPARTERIADLGGFARDLACFLQRSRRSMRPTVRRPGPITSIAVAGSRSMTRRRGAQLPCWATSWPPRL